MKNYKYFILSFLFFFSFSCCQKATIIANKNSVDTTTVISTGKCGIERWNVKTLTDADVSNVNFTPINSTVNELINIVPQMSVGRSSKRFGSEFNTYTIQCHIKKFIAEDDGDYHLVLVDLVDETKTMIGEIADPLCSTTKPSKHINEFIASRNTFENLKKNISSTDIYEITGVVFFDVKHGQTGVAPNGIEIHPILSITRK